MLKNISVTFRDGTYTTALNLPNFCPHCGKTMSPEAFKGVSEFNGSASPNRLGILVQCTADECGKYFGLGYYKKLNDKSYKLQRYDYRPPIKISLVENIDKVSPSFVEIYTQAAKAEEEKLDQIAGVGYRKSLEFLVKDYAIRIYPDEKETIEPMFLGKVIDNYLSAFPKLQSLAKAATWIGNDETHYVRRHDDKDIRDMKQFIKSASQFIAADYDADLAQDFIEENGS